jgi:hypothetical protein
MYLDTAIGMFISFRSRAIELGLCSGEKIWDGVNPLFNFGFNQGDIYCLGTPNAVVELIKFARYHATLMRTDKYTIRSCYGLKGMIAQSSAFERNFIIWDLFRYDKDDPNFISLPEWLEMHGRSFDEV